MVLAALTARKRPAPPAEYAYLIGWRREQRLKAARKTSGRLDVFLPCQRRGRTRSSRVAGVRTRGSRRCAVASSDDPGGEPPSHSWGRGR
jgi:hypothetical protein